MRLSNGEVLLKWPLDLHVITAGWYYSDGSAHSAIDLRTNQNDSIIKPIYAAEDGTVDWIQKWDGHTKTGNQSYGNLIRITHKNYNGKKLQTYYAHLSSFNVKQGDTVKEGQIIGYSGESGNCAGAHLHFEVRLNSIRYNPLNWLDSNFTVASNSVKLGTYTSVVNVDANKNTSSNTTNSNYRIKGIDVSKYQGDIDWNKVKNAGIQFAMLRIVSSNNSGLYIDPYFEKNYNGAKAAGIPVGCYLFTYANNEDEQNEEILLALQALQGKTLEYPFALDVEDNSILSIGKDALTKLVKRGLVIIEQKGYKPMLYTYTNYTPNLNMNDLEGYDLWIADYRGYNGYGNSEIWQYSSKGSVDGISGNVDMNYCYKEYYTVPKVDTDESDDNTENMPPVSDNEIKEEDLTSGKESDYQILTIGPMTSGDANTIRTLSQDLNVPCIESYTNEEKTMIKFTIGLIQTNKAMYIWQKTKELNIGYSSKMYTWPTVE